MEFLTLSGRTRKVNVTPYLIDWDRKVSGPQKTVKDFLRPYWSHDSVMEEFRCPGSLLRVDLLNLSRGIMIEVSPTKVHATYNPFFHGSLSGYRDVIKRDLEKAHWGEINGYKVIEIVDADFPLTLAWFASQGVDL